LIKKYISFMRKWAGWFAILKEWPPYSFLFSSFHFATSRFLLFTF
jgi:hypothetical protein